MAAIGELFADWRRTGQGWVRLLAWPRSRGGLEVPALLFGAPGPVPLNERPTVFLVGGLDGVSFAGGEAVLRAIHGLLLGRETRKDLAFVALPWAAPDGLQRAFDGTSWTGRNDFECDVDLDGRIGEDPPDDLDGDGRALEMLISDPSGKWTPSADPRFLVPAGEGDGPRYRRVPEGADDDRDGDYNEDDARGVCLDRNFPVGWRSLGGGGSLPLSEPVARRLADEVLARRTVLVLVFQGEHGLLARPGSVSPGEGGLDAAQDAETFDRLARAFALHTARKRVDAPALHAVHGEPRPGSFIDWCYGVPGVIAVEVAAWGPGGWASRPPPTAGAGTGVDPMRTGPPLVGVESAWSTWLDEVRGGVGFVPWHQVELGSGVRALVGGWAPRTRHNPPDDELGRALTGMPGFVGECIAALPRLEIVLVEVEREDSLVRLVVHVSNTGALRTSLVVTGRWAGTASGQVHVTLELPDGARLVAGESAQALAPLPGGGLGPRMEWLVAAPAGSVLRVTARTPWCVPAVRELRP
ncbi:MAG: hypothetical protein V3T22_07655 [Planctomycetota bacterium]